MQAVKASPADLSIRHRNRRFSRTPTERRWWLGGNPVATAFYNAISISLPKGETFFIESVRNHRQGASAKLAEEIEVFCKQEVAHSREHVAFNQHVGSAGYDISSLENQVEFRLNLLRKLPPIAGLAATIALEHFTAILAHELLSKPKHLNNADPEVAELWRWHSIEEIEHKGVAYDTWLLATRDWSRFKRWKVKSLIMLRVTRTFMTDRTRGALELLRQDGLSGPRIWFALGWFALAQPGMIRRIMQSWLTYFMPGFHPWNVDDRKLLDTPLAKYSSEALAA
jgi:predicted metal-dependent hydrolase